MVCMENYRAMAIFVQVAECGSFSAAARKLGVTKSAVSQQVRQLEEALGVRLLHRTTRKLSLTEAGELYLQGCRQMVEAAEEASQQVGAYRSEPSGILRVSCSQDFAANYLVPVLGPFFDRYPKLALDIDGSDQIVDLVEEQIDLAIRIGHLVESGLVARKIGDMRELLVAAPEYLSRQGSPKTPADLVNHQWVAFTRRLNPYQLTVKKTDGQRQTVRLYGRAKSNSASTTKQMVVSGMGVGRFLELMVRREIEQGSLVPVLPDYPLESVGLYVVYPQRVHMPLKVRSVIDYLVENSLGLGVVS